MDYLLAGLVVVAVGAATGSIKRYIKKCNDATIENQQRIEQNLLKENQRLREKIEDQTQELLIMMRYVKTHTDMNHYSYFRNHMKTAMMLSENDTD